ncbi:MAG TPA: hypothetical protein VMG30_11765 [Acidobacteriota bacterium]|nr:hypothetical protein [Acidobacteriota bacterium]
MELETKAHIAKATLIGLTALVYLFLLGVLVFVLCVELQINPIKETTTSFLVAAFVGVIGIAAVLVLLNVATNISLIADAKIAELQVVPRRRLLRRWLVAFLAPAIVLVALILGGTYISKERFLAVVRHQADEVLTENKDLLDRFLARSDPVAGIPYLGIQVKFRFFASHCNIRAFQSSNHEKSIELKDKVLCMS